jgi:alpha-glucoside transport system substrate-binding protein
VALGLVLAGCSSVEVAAPAGDRGAEPVGCAAYERYGTLAGATVSVLAPAAPGSGGERYGEFERCTGATVRHETTADLAADLGRRIGEGRVPDLAYLPRAGLLDDLVAAAVVLPAPQAVAANVDQHYAETFREAGSVGGTLYAAPLGAQVRSFVWYSPPAFAERGYPVPTTWDEMLALSDRIVADGGLPWCAPGDGSTPAGFLADVVLREHGPAVYDRWVAHETPFDAPEIVAALDRVGGVVANPAYGNSAASLGDGGCWMQRRSGPDPAADGEVSAFLLPAIDPGAPPAVLVGGEFAVAFSDRPEVAAFQAYLSSPEWANERAAAGGGVSANAGLDLDGLTDPVDRLSAQVLRDAAADVRVDGVDLLPDAVGSGSLPAAIAAWTDGLSSQEALTAVERSWPG